MFGHGMEWRMNGRYPIVPFISIDHNHRSIPPVFEYDGFFLLGLILTCYGSHWSILSHLYWSIGLLIASSFWSKLWLFCGRIFTRMCSLRGVADEWDSCSHVRDMMRNHGSLFVKEAGQAEVRGNIACAQINYHTLKPLVERLEESPGVLGMHSLPDLKKQNLVSFNSLPFYFVGLRCLTSWKPVQYLLPPLHLRATSHWHVSTSNISQHFSGSKRSTSSSRLQSPMPKFWGRKPRRPRNSWC